MSDESSWSEFSINQQPGHVSGVRGVQNIDGAQSGF